MKILIAAPTCQEQADRHQACLRTWASTALCDVRFYTSEEMGVPPEACMCGTDELGLFVRLGQNLSYRLREMCKWALAQGYDYMFKCDLDTYVWVDRLLASGFEQWDYYGFSQDWHVPTFASGGAGYWMSRRAMGVLASQAVADMALDDVWVGIMMHDAGIVLRHDARYHCELPHVLNKSWFTVHYVKNPAVMEAIHRGDYPCEP